jgi:PHD/YefM family antitoxin component YafN of YafNO toxin-antitoxin module
MNLSNLSMKNVMNAIVPITRFNRGEASKVFAELHKTGVKVVLKNNERVGVLVEPQQYDEMIELLEEYALFLEAEHRTRSARAAETLSEGQLLSDLGIDPAELQDPDVELE